MNKLLLIDGNSLINRAYFALPPLNDSDGNNVNAVYGFVNLLLSALTNYAPTHLIVAFDAGGKNFRKDIYPDYKANRKGMPNDLAGQLPILINLLEHMNVKIVMHKGIEADDIIGTLVTKLDIDSIVVTGDRDMLQLVDNNTSVVLTKKGLQEVELVNPDTLQANYQLTSSQIIEYKALRGDTSDNIPGVRGIGEKTAMSLLQRFGDLDGVYNNIDSITGAVKDKLIEGKDLAYISRQLATIVTNLDIDCDIDNCNLPVYNDDVKQLLTHLKFRSIVSRLDFEDNGESQPTQQHSVETVDITTMSQLNQLVADIASDSTIALSIDGNCISIATSNQLQYNIATSDSFLDELTYATVFEASKELFANNKIKKIVFDNKHIKHVLHQYSVQLQGCDYDLALMQYLTQQRSAKNISQLHDELHLPSGCAYMFDALDILLRQLQEIDNMSLYTDIELPLSDVLFDMEQQGVAIDINQLNAMSVEMQQEIDALCQQIYQLCGEEFNIASPKQLSVVLFEKLKLPHFKKTATGYSTNNDVLNKLLDSHPVIALIMQYRQISKLYGTYIEGMRPLIVNGKVHTTYNQYLTTTGRLSSSDPNLQNIPIRSEAGKNIRRLFVPTLDTFVGADYSQIELRLLAAFSNDSNMIDAFANRQDIHARVASELMGVPLEMVNSNMRRMAKAVNFGIIYGISDFGLSSNTGLSVSKAHQYINLFFQRFPTIKQYLDGCVAFAKKNGYVTTLLGRRRYIPEINSSNFNLRGFGERAAMNMPLQGSAADIMKIAMISVAKQLKERNLTSKLVLQIHDEVIVDTLASEVEEVKHIIVNAMNNAVVVNCPLDVDIEVGDNLYEV